MVNQILSMSKNHWNEIMLDSLSCCSTVGSLWEHPQSNCCSKIFLAPALPYLWTSFYEFPNYWPCFSNSKKRGSSVSLFKQGLSLTLNECPCFSLSPRQCPSGFFSPFFSWHISSLWPYWQPWFKHLLCSLYKLFLEWLSCTQKWK